MAECYCCILIHFAIFPKKHEQLSLNYIYLDQFISKEMLLLFAVRNRKKQNVIDNDNDSFYFHLWTSFVNENQHSYNAFAISSIFMLSDYFSIYSRIYILKVYHKKIDIYCILYQSELSFLQYESIILGSRYNKASFML